MTIINKGIASITHMALVCLLLTACVIREDITQSKTRHPASMSQFAVSPDGTRIAYPVPAYDKYGDPATTLWTANMDGSDQKPVDSLTAILFQNISWCGREILAASQSSGDATYLIPVSGGEWKKLSIGEFYGFFATISPNGKQVALTGHLRTGADQKMGIFLLDVATGQIKKISKAVVKSRLAWSPDSKKLAYGIGGYQKNYKIQILDVETSAASKTELDGVGIAWSPDGKWLAYTGKIVQGGSWWQGIAIDGSIMIKNLETDASMILTEPATNIYDKKTERWEISGAYNPLWSPDGKRIAYFRDHCISEGKKDKLGLNEIWVVNVDGSGRHKVFDRRMPFAWAPDSDAILVKNENKITWIPLDGGKAHTVVAWQHPIPPKTDKATKQTLKAPGVEIIYTGINPAYAKAILTLAAEARRIYAGTFKCNMPETIQIRINKDPDSQTSLWTDGENGMFLTLKSNADLKPPMQSGVFNIYGVCHELGHIAMYRNVNCLGLPEGVPEGWAHYAGSLVVDEVYKKFGPTLWPDPYDYADTEGLARIARRTNDTEALKSPLTRAAVTFYAVHQRYGAAKVIEAMNTAMEGRPHGKDLMPRFVNALVKSTGDESARNMFADDLLSSKIEWQVAEREIGDKTVTGLIQEQDKTGVLLRYDDGNSEDMQSTAGAGHAVVFKTPPGRWAVDYVSMYGSRYGTDKPPKEDFQVFICDKNFEVINEIKKPYSLLEKGKPKWHKVDFAPAPVPEYFYVCIYFSPTQTRGFYMHLDKSPKQSHSKSALPFTFVTDIRKNADWMIRVHLVPAKD